jgi:hypothetical protein
MHQFPEDPAWMNHCWSSNREETPFLEVSDFAALVKQRLAEPAPLRGIKLHVSKQSNLFVRLICNNIFLAIRESSKNITIPSKATY